MNLENDTGDFVIRALIAGERAPIADDITAILATMLLAQFNTQLERAPTELRGAVYAGLRFSHATSRG